MAEISLTEIKDALKTPDQECDFATKPRILTKFPCSESKVGSENRPMQNNVFSWAEAHPEQKQPAQGLLITKIPLFTVFSRAWVGVCNPPFWKAPGRDRWRDFPTPTYQLGSLCSSYKLRIGRSPVELIIQLLNRHNVNSTASDSLNICFCWCMSKKTLVS